MVKHTHADSCVSLFKQEAISLAQLIGIQGLSNPDSPALVIADQSYNYAELVKKTQQLAGLLQKNNIKRLGIWASKTLEAYVGVLAAHWVGIAYVPLNPAYPLQRLKNIIHSSQLDAVVVDELRLSAADNFISTFAPQLKKITLDDIYDITPLTTACQVWPSDLAYLIFTSGTSGEPKGVPITFGNLASFIKAQHARYSLTATDRVSQFSSLSFDVSVFDLCLAFGAGAALYVVPEYTQMAPAKFIYENKLTVWLSVPGIINNMSRLNMLRANCFDTLRYSLFTGEALTLAQAQWWLVAAPASRLENLYGPTEATIDCLGQVFSEQNEETFYRDQVAIGQPFENMLAALIDENENFLAPDAKGQLLIAGPQVASGYWNDKYLSAQKFKELVHPQWGKQRWFLTGDLCYQDGDGAFHFIRRLDNQRKILGNRIELEEIEFNVRDIADCSEAAACVVNNGFDHEIAVIMNSINLDRENLMNQLRERLPGYMLPTAILYREALLYTAHGKIDRVALCEWASQNLDSSLGGKVC